MDTNTIESERVHVDSEEDLVEVKSSDTMSKKDPKNIGNKTIHISGKNFKRQRKLTSGVWVNFEFVDETDEDGNLFCKCKKCEKMFRADSKMGTGNLIRHVKNCKMRTFRDVGQMILENSTAGLANKLPVFDVAIFRELLALAIVRHDLPFQFVEYEGIRRLFSYLNPTTKTISRNTSKSDVVKMYEREKENLKFLLGSISSRICLTSDCWSSITSDGYITLTAHYVDDNWVLKKKLLNFCFMPPPHTGVHLSDHVCSLLKDWGILQKIFSITLDNAASNDVFADCLKGELELLCAGEFFHVRCCAHIMNLVVQDGLKEIDDAVIKVRESVKYCKGSQARKQRFLSCIEHVGLQSSKGLKQDVITRWNSTYLMLESALYYKKALIHFQKVDANYIHCPTAEEWAKIEKIFKFLKVFYEATLAFSGTKYPTANLYFPNVLRVRLLLKSEMESTDGFMKKMACKMYEKFGKYWSDFSIIMAVAIVLDPRFKLQFVQWSFKKVYGDGVDYEVELAKVREKTQEIYNIYALKLSATSPRQKYGSLHVGNIEDATDEFMTVSF